MKLWMLGLAVLQLYCNFFIGSKVCGNIDFTKRPTAKFKSSSYPYIHFTYHTVSIGKNRFCEANLLP